MMNKQQKDLLDKYHILIIVDYEYECTDTSYYYKIYRLGEHGKPERVSVWGISYDKDGEPNKHIVSYRDYERSYKNYATYDEALEDGIKQIINEMK